MPTPRPLSDRMSPSSPKPRIIGPFAVSAYLGADDRVVCELRGEGSDEAIRFSPNDMPDLTYALEALSRLAQGARYPI